MIAFLNSQFIADDEARISLFDRGFAYGDGLFETLRIYNGVPFRWGEHWKRLERGADFLKISLPFSSAESFCLVEQLLEKNQLRDAVLRINLSRGTGPRGYSIKGANQSTFAMSVYPVAKAASSKLKLMTSSLRLLENDPLAEFKHTNKLLQIAARTEAESKHCDDALLLNTKDQVAETTTANFFWITDGTVFTPSLQCGALPGITRAAVFELCRALKIAMRETALSRALLKPEAAFITASVLEIVEVASLDNVQFTGSPLLKRIRDGYSEIVRQECC